MHRVPVLIEVEDICRVRLTMRVELLVVIVGPILALIRVSVFVEVSRLGYRLIVVLWFWC